MEATPSEEVAAQVAEDMESFSPENNSEPQQKPACSAAKIDQLVSNKEPSTPESTPAKLPNEMEDKSLAKVNRETTPHEVGDEKEEAPIEEERMNKSKRVSGQGVERQKENRTPPPKTKKFHNIRAVSTPQVSLITSQKVKFMYIVLSNTLSSGQQDYDGFQCDAGHR